MNPLGRSGDTILSQTTAENTLGGSSWHFFQCKSWLDYALRTQHPSAIHFAAFELRYGVEYLLYELLVLTSESFTEADYKKCIGDKDEIKKRLGPHATNYEKLAEFTVIVHEISGSPLKLKQWKIKDLIVAWGVASEFLHFLGSHKHVQSDVNWLITAIARLQKQLDPIWVGMTEYCADAILRPSRMSADVKVYWQEFSSGTLSKEDLILRMKLRFPSG